MLGNQYNEHITYMGGALMLSLHQQLCQSLRAHANPERAFHEKRYLKSTDTFLGVSVPAGQAIARALRKSHPDLSSDEIRALAITLWHSEVHEERRLAVQLLDRYVKLLTRDDWPMLEDWARASGSWDLLDEIAAHLLASLAERYPEFDVHFDTWVHDDNFWLRRAALVSHVVRLRHGSVTPARVRHLCTPLMTDPEYFIKKAVGWLLRECAVRDPEGTVAFLLPWKGRTARPVLREAVRKLPDNLRCLVLD